MDNQEQTNPVAGAGEVDQGFIVAVFIGHGIPVDPTGVKVTYMPGIHPGKEELENGEQRPVELRHGDLVPLLTIPSLYDLAVRSEQFAREELHDQIMTWLGEGKTGSEILELVKAQNGLISPLPAPSADAQ